jgi:hypothetical protein
MLGRTGPDHARSETVTRADPLWARGQGLELQDDTSKALGSRTSKHALTTWSSRVLSAMLPSASPYCFSKECLSLLAFATCHQLRVVGPKTASHNPQVQGYPQRFTIPILIILLRATTSLDSSNPVSHVCPGIGVFIAFVGLKQMGAVVQDDPPNLVQFNKGFNKCFLDPSNGPACPWLSLAGLTLTGILTVYHLNGSLLIGTWCFNPFLSFRPTFKKLQLR